MRGCASVRCWGWLVFGGLGGGVGGGVLACGLSWCCVGWLGCCFLVEVGEGVVGGAQEGEVAEGGGSSEAVGGAVVGVEGVGGGSVAAGVGAGAVAPGECGALGGVGEAGFGVVVEWLSVEADGLAVFVVFDEVGAGRSRRGQDRAG